MNRSNALADLQELYTAGLECLDDVSKTLNPKLLALFAGLALSACKEPDYGGVELADTPPPTEETDADVDSDTDADADADSDADKGPTGETTMNKADCEGLFENVTTDEIADDTFVVSNGAACAYDTTSYFFTDGNFRSYNEDGTLSLDSVYACVYNAVRDAAETTTVTSVDGILTVEASNIPLVDDPIIILRFVNTRNEWMVDYPSNSYPDWQYFIEGECMDMAYMQ